MATISEVKEALPKRLLEMAIYNALGKELTNELKANKCELIIHDDLQTYEFKNITTDLQSKIDEKKRK